MNRREFFRRLGPSTAIASTALAACPVAGAVVTLPDSITRDGVSARWLSWRLDWQTDRLWSAWVFTLPDQRSFYSSTGGVCAPYAPGHCFNLMTITAVAPILLSDADEETRYVQRQAAYDRGWAYYRAGLPEE